MPIVEKSMETAEAEKSGNSSCNTVSEDSPAAAFVAAYKEYSERASKIWDPIAANKRVSEVMSGSSVDAPNAIDYASHLESQAAAYRKMQEAWLPGDTQKDFVQAFRDFVQAIHKALGNLDWAAISPSDLSAISNAMQMGASLVSIPWPKADDDKPKDKS